MNALVDFFVSLRIENNNNLNLETMINMSNPKDSERPPPDRSGTPTAGRIAPR